MSDIISVCGQNLENLDLSGACLTGDGFPYSGLKLPKLTSLDVSGCRNLSYTGLAKMLRNCADSLEKLCMDGSNILDVDVYHLDLEFKRMRVLSMNAQLGDNALQTILGMCKYPLQTLYVSCSGVTGVGICGVIISYLS